MRTPTKSVLILSDSDGFDDEIGLAFQARGFLTHEIQLEEVDIQNLPKFPPKAIVLHIQHETPAIEAEVQRITSAYSGVNIPVLALLNSTPPVHTDIFDSTLLAPYHPMQIVLRAMGLIRLSEMEQEIALRLETLQEDFNITPELTKSRDSDRFKILFIGKATPEFMVIINALQKEHVNVVAAFTSFTAFDYLYEQTFDAVVMNGLGGNEPAFSVMQTMRKNAQLYHVPALLLVNSETFSDEDAAYYAGVNDIIDANAALDEISSRILEQANFYRTHSDLKADFGSLGGDACVDVTTKLYNQRFFNAHLARVFNVYEAQDLPISLCLIRVRSAQEIQRSGHHNMVYAQIGSMIKNLVRMQDITSRLDDNLFVIAFPGQSPEALKPVADRISSILKCANISDQNTGRPLNLDLEITFSQLQDTERTKSIA